MQPLFFRFLFFIFLSFSTLFVSAQLNIKVGEHYMDGVPIKKLHVCVEDHSVWALTNTGKVYYKLSSDDGFSIYPNTSNLQISGVTGFNAKEMYFISGVQVYQIINGVENPMQVPFEGVTKINDISVVYSKNNESPLNPEIQYKDYLAVATNKNLCFLLRGDNKISIPYHPSNVESVNEPDYQISYSGFKYVDYRFIHPLTYCGIDITRMTDNLSYGYTLWSTLADKAPYPTKINATVTGWHYYQPFKDGLPTKFIYNIWATDEGVYHKEIYSPCSNPDIRKDLDGENINTLENTYALTPIYKQDFVLAGSNTGIFYTKRSIFPETMGNPSLNFMKFDRLADFPSVKVNVIKTETTVLGYLDMGQEKYDAVCEKIVWAATEKGLFKLYLSLDQEYYSKLKWNNMLYDKIPSNNDYSNPVFQLCGDQKLTVTARQPENFANQLLFQWFKDGIELPELVGKLSAELSDPGIYTVKLTSLCDQITVSTEPITIRKNDAPEIDFPYPENVILCSGNTFSMQTKLVNGYNYKWYKDDIQIEGASGNTYIADASGKYRVEVSNCADSYQSSSSVNLKIAVLPVAVVKSDRIYYCENTQAILSINNQEHLKVKWYFNNVEKKQYENQDQITVSEEGLYKAVFFNDSECKSASVPYQFIRRPLPTITILKSSMTSLCEGESMRLTAVSADAADYRWSTGETTPSIIVNTSGSYSVEVTSAYNCKAQSDEAVVTVNARPVLEKPDDLTVCAITKEKVKLKAPDGFAFYSWNGKKGTANFYEVVEPGIYTLEVEDQNGCKSVAYYNVLSKCSSVLAPNAFSPNGDAVNDVWKISGLEEDPAAEIAIYNRYGMVIFNTSGKKPFWDGSSKNGIAPVGTYYYIIKTRNSKQAIKGSITLIR